MTKAEIVKQIAESTGIEKTAVMAIVEGLMETVKDSIIKGEPVYLRGFGTFEIKHKAAKTGRVITSNTTILIPERDAPSFKPSKEFKAGMER